MIYVIIPSVKALLVGINAKFVQTNLAIRLIKGWAEARSRAVRDGRAGVEIGEWNINQSPSSIVRGIVEREPDVVLFSVYIWNRETVFRVADDLRLLLPDALIVMGGPEVSWTAADILAGVPAVDAIAAGEGEATVAELIDRVADLCGVNLAGAGGENAAAGNAVADRRKNISDIPGLFARDGDGGIRFGGARPLIENLDEIPFPYSAGKLDFDPENRIVYYESSRGCPYSCAYCLSANDSRVRYRSLERVLADIDFFLQEGFPLVKFVDRTFNLDPARYLAIWRHIAERFNGKTTFHFEIAGEGLSDEAFAVLEGMPRGAVQFEIGIQSTNPETLRAVHRAGDTRALFEKIRRIPRTIHVHVDLIAGLPGEGFARFGRSFDDVWSLGADMLQLGFLKILPGAPMEGIAKGLEGYLWSAHPPYEVLETPDLSWRELLRLKDVEHLADGWFNSGLARHALTRLAEAGRDSSAFSLFLELADFVREWFPDGDLYLPRRPAAVFECLAGFIAGRRGGEGSFLEYLKYDYFLQGKPGAMPDWLTRRYSREAHDSALVREGLLSPAEGAYAPSRRVVYARSEYEEFAFNAEKDPEKVLFIYPGPGDKERLPRCIIM